MPWWGFALLVPLALVTAIPSYGFSIFVVAMGILDKLLRSRPRYPMRSSVNRHTQGLVNHASAINRAVLNKPPTKDPR